MKNRYKILFILTISAFVLFLIPSQLRSDTADFNTDTLLAKVLIMVVTGAIIWVCTIDFSKQ
jgi:hypothetical protein